MNLYDLMGAVAVRAGAGFSYGIAPSHGLTWWGSLVPGVFGGAVTFLGMRRLTLRARSRSEGVLAFLYVLSFVAVFAATVGVSWAGRLGFSS